MTGACIPRGAPYAGTPIGSLGVGRGLGIGETPEFLDCMLGEPEFLDCMLGETGATLDCIPLVATPLYACVLGWVGADLACVPLLT